MFSFSYILAQLCGSVAFGFQTYSGQAKDQRRLTLFLGISNLFWVAHYVALDVPLAAIIALLIGIQLLVSSFAAPKYKRPIIIVFIVLYWVAAYFSLRDPFHILPAIGSSLFSFSLLASRSIPQLLPAVGTSFLSFTLLSNDKVKVVRLGVIVSFSLWMVHGFFTGSIVEVIANGVPLGAALFGLLYFDMGLQPPGRMQKVRRFFRFNERKDE